MPSPSEVGQSQIVSAKIAVFRPFFGSKWSLTAKPSTFDPIVLYIIGKLSIWHILKLWWELYFWPHLKRQNFRDTSGQICYPYPISCHKLYLCICRYDDALMMMLWCWWTNAYDALMPMMNGCCWSTDAADVMVCWSCWCADAPILLMCWPCWSAEPADVLSLLIGWYADPVDALILLMLWCC